MVAGELTKGTKMAHWSSKVKVEFSTIADRLHILTSTEPRKGGGASHKHTYFLECDTGNLLFHGPGRPGFFKEHREFFDEHGGIALQVMPHGDDASPACLFVEETWGAPIFVSRWDVAQVQKRTKQPFEGGFENGAKPASEVDSFHLPGHTAGFHCFRWEGNSEKYLFASHLIVPTTRRQRWKFALTPILKEVGLKSLKELRSIDVDFLLPNRSGTFDASIQSARAYTPPIPFGPDVRSRAIDEALASIEGSKS